MNKGVFRAKYGADGRILSVPAISNKANTIRKETAKEPHEFIFAAIVLPPDSGR
jgi:hypothetical protein